MLNLTANAIKVFLALDPCDMRKSFNGLQQIAGLQQRFFGSSSEKLDSAQLQLEMDEILLGKPPTIPGKP